MRRLCSTLGLGVLCLALAAPAAAQTNPSIPDIPGNGPIRRAIEARLRQAPATANLPPNLAEVLSQAAQAAPQQDLPPLPAPDTSQSLDPAGTDTRPAAATAPRSRRSGGSLPATGIPAMAFALIGIALMSGGRLLVELTGRTRAA